MVRSLAIKKVTNATSKFDKDSELNDENIVRNSFDHVTDEEHPHSASIIDQAGFKKRKVDQTTIDCINKTGNESSEEEEEDDEEKETVANSEMVPKIEFERLQQRYGEMEAEKKKLSDNFRKAVVIISKNKYASIEGDFTPQELSGTDVKSLIRYTKDKIFPFVKLINKKIFDEKKEILQKAFSSLQKSKLSDQQMLRDSAMLTVKYALAQKRRYCKDKLMHQYQGKLKKTQKKVGVLAQLISLFFNLFRFQLL
jgi:hypothetical protein